MADDRDSRSSNTSDTESESEVETKKVITPNKSTSTNAFKNDGSFMEMFKKMQEERNKQDSTYFDKPNVKKEDSVSTNLEKAERPSSSSTSETTATPPIKKPSMLSFVGKRRGGRVLPTGMVAKKSKKPEPGKDGEPEINDAWSRYLSEVRKYREQSCEEEGKRRPLVK